MDTLLELVSQGVEQLLGRASGPMRLRLVMMPTVVTVMAIRAGLRDAREGRPAFFWAVLTSPNERGPLVRSATKDIGRVFLVALLLDTIYQLVVLGQFRIVQLLIVAVACAIVPYVLIRGPVTRIARLLRKPRTADDGAAAAHSAAPSQSKDD